MTFERELTQLINKYSQENPSNTPDYILAGYLVGCLAAWNMTMLRRTRWFGPSKIIETDERKPENAVETGIFQKGDSAEHP